MTMQTKPHTVVKSRFLPRAGALVLDNAEGTVLEVESGCLWVTLERDPRDVVLVPGMRFEIDRTGRTVVVAEADSHVRIHQTEHALARIAEWVTRRLAPGYVRWADRQARRPLYFF
jgi:hypothetical protein